MLIARLFVILLGLSVLGACASNDLAETPADLGDFTLGLNIVTADNMQKVPISRTASAEEWQAAMKKAIDDRFGRYDGKRVYNIGVSVDAYALAPPGVPLLVSPKSALVVTAHIWDDAKALKLNEKGKQITVFESLDADTAIGSGLTKTAAQQMESLSYNAAKSIEKWLVQNPEWFDLSAKGAKTAVVDAAGDGKSGK